MCYTCSLRREADIELTIHILASGSSGNCIFLQAGTRAILLDTGISYRELARRADAVGADLSLLKGIIISHEHTDHISGASVTAARHKLPVFLNRNTHEEVFRRRREFDIPNVEHFGTGDSISFNGLSVRTFSVPHDAADPVGFVITWEGLRVGVATDVGQSTRLVEERLRDCHALVIESNHDIAMLDAGTYPPELKRRIKGKNGHLSNEQCAELLTKLHHEDLRHVALAHLSEANNTPRLAFSAASRSMPANGRAPKITVANQTSPVVLRLSARGEAS